MMNSGKIYKYRKPVSIVISVILAVLLFLVITAVILYFSFQKYIVYTDDGVRLEVPWLEETAEQAENEHAEASSAEDAIASE